MSALSVQRREAEMFPPPATTNVALAMAAAATTVLLVIAALGARTPLLWRMGRREIVRRPGRTATMLVGLTLSTVFITAAFGLQDSFRASAVAYRLAQVGQVDETVTGTFTSGQVSDAAAHFDRSRDVRAVTELYTSVGTTLTRAGSGGTPASSYLYGIQPNFESVYGALVDQHGRPVRVSDLTAGEVILSRSAAQSAGARAGQRITFGWDQLTVTVTVVAVLGNDPVFTTGELNQDTATASVIAPLGTVEGAFAQQYHHALIPNTLCIRNAGTGGAHSSAVVSSLQQLFGVTAIDPASRHGTFAPIYFDETLIHPLQPTVVDYTGGLSQISNKAEYTSSPAARQANWLQPAFTTLLVGAGLLLLALQCLLLAVERRAELGMSRAQGLQRRHIVTGMVIEGCVYAAIAAIVGVPLGAWASAGEISVLNHLPTVALGGSAPFQFADVTFRAALRWQSGLLAGGLSLLAALAIVALAAAAVSRTTIVAAIRNLGEPPRPAVRLTRLFREILPRRAQVGGQLMSDTRAHRRERHTHAAVGLLSELSVRGWLPLAAGAALVGVASVEGVPSTLGLSLVSAVGFRTLGISLMMAGGGLCLRSMARRLPAHADLAQHAAVTLLGVGWLAYGLTTGDQFFRAMFAANLADTGLNHTGPYSLLEILLDLLLPLAGVIVVVIRNADLPAALLTALTRRIRPLAPISRSSLVHPLTFRGRTGVTITLLGAVTFLVTLLVVSNAAVSNAAVGGHAQAGGPYTAVLTAFLTGYLALGLVFGALAIGVIASRAVVERRQEIGMLRALGFSRRLVRLEFILETSFIVALGLLPATVLALGLVTEIAHLNGEHPTFPLVTVAMLVAGAFLVAILAVSIPAHRASRIPPAEALRVE
jgi:ABC-type lipoprotein release transport system permease subunit